MSYVRSAFIRHYWLLARTNDGRIAAVTPAGSVPLLGADGRLEGRVELGARVTAVVRPGDQRTGDLLLLGTSDGRMMVGP